ncbi:MAG: winged helix-turn-helix transcriptional regulator [Candidatus Bathyarchaeia archaeon]
MPSSKLELYIDIAKTLMAHGPLSVDELAQFLKSNPSSLKERVSFLIDQGLIRETEYNSIISYTITNQGTKILRFFKVQPLTKTTFDY